MITSNLLFSYIDPVSGMILLQLVIGAASAAWLSSMEKLGGGCGG